MLDHVLVPLDRSRLAEHALQYATHLVGQRGQITLLSVIEELPDAVFPSDIYVIAGDVIRQQQQQRQDARQPAENYLQQISHRLAGPHLTINTLALSGHPAELIIDTARSMNVSAIVMSTHGRAGLSRWMYGSVTQKVLSAAPCPVFVIPSRMFAESEL